MFHHGQNPSGPWLFHICFAAADSFFRFPSWYITLPFSPYSFLSFLLFFFTFFPSPSLSRFDRNVTNCLSSSRWQLVASSYRDAWPRPSEISSLQDSLTISRRYRKYRDGINSSRLLFSSSFFLDLVCFVESIAQSTRFGISLWL